MTLISSSLLNGFAVGIKLIASLVINKYLAVNIGVNGYGLLGQFNSFVAIASSFASAGITNGVIKYTAERHDTPMLRRRLWSTATQIILIVALMIALTIAVLSSWLASNLLNDSGQTLPFYWLAACVVSFALNSLLTSILNGLKQLRSYVLANIAGTIASFILTFLLALKYGLQGALIAASVSQLATFVCTCIVARRWISEWLFHLEFDKRDAQKLGSFSLMALISTLCVPLTQLLVRDHIGSTLGWHAVSAWQAVYKISDMYLMLITSALSVYYLPRLSEIKTKLEMRSEILKAYRFAMPFTIMAAGVCYSLRDWIISVLFSPEFSAMRDLFLYQVIGDVFRIGSWLIAFVFHARALMRLFIISELIYAVIYYVLVHFLTARMGIQGSTLAYAISYGLYWIWVGYILKDQLFEVSTVRTAQT